MQGFKDCDLVSSFNQFTCCRQTRWPGTHNSYLGAGGRNWLYLLLAVLSCPVGCKPFQAANGYRFILDADNTELFTLLFLGTDTAAYCRQTVLILENINGTLKIFFFNFPNEAGDI